MYVMYTEMADSPKKWPKGIDHFKIATFNHLSGMANIVLKVEIKKNCLLNLLSKDPFGLCTPHPTRYQYPLIRYLGVDDPIGKLGKWFISCWISSSGAWFPPAIINWLWSSFLLLIELSSGVSIVLFFEREKSRYNRVLYAQEFHDSIHIV